MLLLYLYYDMLNNFTAYGLYGNTELSNNNFSICRTFTLRRIVYVKKSSLVSKILIVLIETIFIKLAGWMNCVFINVYIYCFSTALTIPMDKYKATQKQIQTPLYKKGKSLGKVPSFCSKCLIPPYESDNK